MYLLCRVGYGSGDILGCLAVGCKPAAAKAIREGWARQIRAKTGRRHSHHPSKLRPMTERGSTQKSCNDGM
jgi:hypothetical protein